MAIDIYQKIRSTPLWQLVRISDDYYMVNAKLREYHNTLHATMVVHYVNVLTDFDPSLSLIVAAQWHDAVYFPGAGSDANERCSSTALGIAARDLARSAEFTQEQKDAVNKAQDLIENTSVAVHLMSQHEIPLSGLASKGELAILLDADLASLASDWDKFVELQSNIIRENGGTVPDDYGNSAKFLVSFLRCRKFIYHTEKGRELWEEKAKANITRWCSENGVKIKDDTF